MSNAQAAAVTENGVQSVPQEENPGYKVFLYFYSTLSTISYFFSKGLCWKSCLHYNRWWAEGFLCSCSERHVRGTLHSLIISFMFSAPSLSAQVILRGTRSAGYGFVALATADAAQKAVQVLDKKELDGRQVIVEIAKPSDQKDKDRKERKSKRRPGRRGSKAVPGEVSEAEANGDASKAEDPNPAEGDAAAKPKKKKKSAVCPYCIFHISYQCILTSLYPA